MRRFLVFSIPLIALCAMFGTTLAQSGGTYTLAWFTPDSGGKSTGGSYVVQGAAGQPDAGKLTGGPYTVTGGYMAAGLGSSNSPQTLADVDITTPTETQATKPRRTRKAAASQTETGTPPRTGMPVTETVCAAKPAKPLLRKPARGAVVSTPRVPLKWKKASCARTYDLVVKNVNTHLKAAQAKRLTKSNHKVRAFESGKYKWYVRACNPSGCTKSAVRFFTMQ